MKSRYFGGAGLTEESGLFYPKYEVDAEIKRLRGLISWASGKLLGAGQDKDAELILFIASKGD